MRNLIFTVSILLACNALNAQTSVEEYNYLSTGYKVQVVEQGGDLKKGYELKNIPSSTSTIGQGGGLRKGWLKGFYKIEGTNKKLVAYLVNYQLNDKPVEYICIPHPSSDKTILARYLNALYDGNEKVNSGFRLQLISYLLTTAIKWQ